ncbi:hypothetical protein ASPZODRAFT_1354781 [Penicilliopsis zonata CBS 506.65]|uniref:Carrier domain-containing protein n=1 Tax=Penicilliopsis zonata CBS 506.65 TaxID=1073090 RepID=A0A1L9SP88_9EURO|nr:hypothetical protein ASPZODRAFT_1354781 [Penicilliopsis zonata CBS 506.65]OJJ48921.1 hypothetical protein ASPZODRAFT_1354781 [Penicilliopsis zonata CBS 506.65]
MDLHLHQDNEILVNIVDRRARESPQLLYAAFPVLPTSYDAGYREINYAQLANAVNGAAWHISRLLGPGKNFETLAYIGPNDLRYNTLVLGAVKAGYKMFLSSPRNSIAAHSHLFKLLDCKTILIPDPQPAVVDDILKASSLRALAAPSLAYLIDTLHPEYPYTKTFEDAKHEPLLAFHTSGSTGLPKPITWSHDYAAAAMKCSRIDPPEGFELQERVFQGSRLFFMLPPFHAANHIASICYAFAHRMMCIYPPAGAIPSAKVLADGLKHIKADLAFVPPTVVAELGRDATMLEFVCSNLKTLATGGGDVPTALGDPVAKRMRLMMVYGSSEMGIIPLIRRDATTLSEDWKPIMFTPGLGIVLRPVNENVYELYQARDPEIEWRQPVFKLYPHLDIFKPGDLFSPHPSKPDIWIYCGRSDDIIVFLTGEKTNPTTMEASVASNPEIKACLVAGAQRFQASLILELADPKEMSLSQKAEAIERIWPTINEANRVCPNHAKVSKSHILFADPKKPFARTSKGTLQRRLTISMYTEELDALYEDAERLENANVINGKISKQPNDSESLGALIRQAIMGVTGWSSLEDDTNIFIIGMDSLQTLLLTRNLREELAIAEIAPSTVYTNPSVSQLARAILDLSASQQASLGHIRESRKHAISSLITQHQSLIDELASSLVVDKPAAKGVDQKRNVLLTGSTGAVGSYLLQTLLRSPSVSHIYCLNRSPNSSSLQEERNKARKLATIAPSERVTFLTVDLSQEFFGLEPEVYNQLQSNATDILLNAWPVNFNIPLDAFMPQLSGITNVVKFALHAQCSPSIFFISSISSMLSHPESPIPESIMMDTSAPAPMGYGESKYIAERILDYAAQKLHMNVKIARVGQVAGPIHSAGTWNKWEWLPSLVISSLHVGALPDSLSLSPSQVDWVPIDTLAEVLVELLLGSTPASKAETATVFHIVNPYVTTWAALLPTLVATLERSSHGKKKIEIVSLKAWLQIIKADAEANRSDVEKMLERNPALKVLSIYETFSTQEAPRFESERAKRASQTLREMEAIKPEWMDKWCEGWLS